MHVTIHTQNSAPDLQVGAAGQARVLGLFTRRPLCCDMIEPKCSLPAGGTEDAREIRQTLHLGLRGPHRSPLRGDPHCPCAPPCPRLQMDLFWRWFITSLRQLWLSTSNSKQSQQAQGWQAAVEKQEGGSPEWGGGRREHVGVRSGGPFCGQGPHDCLLGSCSGRCAAQLPGGRLTRLSSPHWCLPTRDQARACSREKGICEQPFPLPVAGVCRAGSHCRDVITRRRVTHGSAGLPLGLTAAGRCSPLADTMWFLGSSFVTALPHAGHGSRGEPRPLFYSSLPIPCNETAPPCVLGGPALPSLCSTSPAHLSTVSPKT